jgi:hypothetical protein
MATAQIRTSRDAKTGKFLVGPLGKPKATKFALVEGVTLSDEAARIMRQHETSGKSGSAFRAALAGSYTKKR